MIDPTPYKSKLEALLQTVTKELETLGVRNPEYKDDWISTPHGVDVGEADPNVGADRVEEWDERRATLSQLETRYTNIKRALKKIEDGTFGVCEVSGKSIEPDRLDANPAARTCKAHMGDEKDLPVSL